MATISIFDMLTRVTEDVFEATQERQSPYFEGTLRGYFSFNPNSTPTTPSTPLPTPPEPNPGSQSVATSLDLTRLRSLTQAGNWREADGEIHTLSSACRRKQSLTWKRRRSISHALLRMISSAPPPAPSTPRRTRILMRELRSSDGLRCDMFSKIHKKTS